MPKLLTPEQILANIGNNLKLLTEKHRVSYNQIAESIRSDATTLRYLSAQQLPHPDSYLIYRMAHYFDYDLDTFILHSPEQLEPLKPTLPKFSPPLSSKEFHEHHQKNIAFMTQGQTQSLEDVMSQAGLVREKGKLARLNIHQLHATSHTLGIDAHSLSKAPFEETLLKAHKLVSTTPNPKIAEIEGVRNKLLKLVEHQGTTIEAFAEKIHYPRSLLIRFVTGASHVMDIDVLYHAATACGTTVDEFLAAPIETLFSSAPKSYEPKAIDLKQHFLNNLESQFPFSSSIEASLEKFRKSLGFQSQEFESLKNYYVVRQISHHFGFETHTFLSSPPEKLPKPNPSLMANALKKTTKALAVAATGLLAATPSIAVGLAVESVADELEKTSSALLNPELATEHPDNLMRQFGISTVQMILDLCLLPGHFIDESSKEIIERQKLSLMEYNDSLIDNFILSMIGTLHLPIDLIRGYLKSTESFTHHAREALVTFEKLIIGDKASKVAPVESLSNAILNFYFLWLYKQFELKRRIALLFINKYAHCMSQYFPRYATC